MPTLTATEVGRWAQTTVPTDLTAVFGPDTVPTGNPVTVGTVTDAQWRGAQLSALDVNGRQANTASYGGTANQDTGSRSEPWVADRHDRVRHRRPRQHRPVVVGRQPGTGVGGEPDRGHGGAKGTSRLDSRNVFSVDGKDLLRTYGPARQAL